MMTLDLPESTAQRLAALAARTGLPADVHALEAIEAHLDELEDVAQAEQIVERVRRGEEKVYSAAEVEQALAVDN